MASIAVGAGDVPVQGLTGLNDSQSAIMGRLKAGNEYFSAKMLKEDPHYFEKLAEGQNPKIAAVTCSDSRSALENVAHTRPGEIFMIAKNAGAVVYPKKHGPAVVASATYAFKELNSIEIALVLGHYLCGGVIALDDFEKLDEAIKSHLRLILPAKQFIDGLISEDKFDVSFRHEGIVESSVLLSTLRFNEIDAVKDAVADGLIVKPAIYDIVDNGKLHFGTPVLEDANLVEEAYAQLTWMDMRLK